MISLMFSGAIGYAIVANGCAPKLGTCGYVGTYINKGDVTSVQPQSRKSTDFPKSITYVQTVMEIGTVKKTCEITKRQVECSPCRPGTRRCIDCYNAPVRSPEIKPISLLVNFDEEPPNHGAPNCSSGKCGTGTR